jgi:hypothetical protein
MKVAVSVACATAGAYVGGLTSAFITPGGKVNESGALLRLRGSSGGALHTSREGLDVQAKPARVGSSFRGLLGGASAAAVALVFRGKRSHPHGGKSARAAVSVGDPIPDVSLDDGFPAPGSFALKEFCKGKKVVLVGLPGAFTGT